LPDATGLELLAQDLGKRLQVEVEVTTSFHRCQAMVEVEPRQVHRVLRHLKEEAAEPFPFLASLHGVDYHPDEPRLSVHYQLLSMERRERLGVRTRMSVEEAEVPTVVDLWPGANLPEREVYDFFGIVFDGHPDPRRSHMPEDYEGHPLRRDFPIGGEPVLFTFNEKKMPRWYD
jgi:NADH-quinone oxidoreductase subunit C